MVGLLQQSLLTGAGVGESSGFVAEQLAFQQFFWNCRAINRDEAVRRSRTFLVEQCGNHFFAGASLSL